MDGWTDGWTDGHDGLIMHFQFYIRKYAKTHKKSHAFAGIEFYLLVYEHISISAELIRRKFANG